MRKWLFFLSAAIAVSLAVPAHAATIFTATLNGAQAGIVTSGSGAADVTLSTDQSTLTVDVTFQDLTDVTTVAHIHCCAGPGSTAGVALPFVNFPVGVQSGSYTQSFDLTLDATYSGGFLGANGGTAAGAQATLISNMLAGLTYVNIHTAFAAGGEIRGQLATASAIPEPASLGLIGLGLVGLAVLRKRRGAC
jgi:hypothetical protein